MNTKICATETSQNFYIQLGTVCLRKIERILKLIAFILLAFYRSFLTAFFGGSCRFEPSCSEYARDAFHYHRIDQAFVLTLKRLLKCRPGGPYGYDPVPNPEPCKHVTDKRMCRNEP